jgi:UTP--glucose-1-phosphate uridylyltransferase
MQHKKPRIWKETLTPAVWPADPELEWCPPGHGDIYVSLLTSGMLETMLSAGYEYLFVSNSDNLGAVLDAKVLGYFAAEKLPFLMEVADRTLADNKGGHLSMRPDGQLILRELSQCPPDEIDQFQDVHLYRYFNTNNLWLHLPSLRQVLHDHGDMLDLPLIRNEKPIDATDPESRRVYQLETAMGSAISRFEGARALRVPRSRFVPVKKNNDLLAIWSDVYELREDYQLHLSADCRALPVQCPPLVFLDDRYYQLIGDLTDRFPYGAPSMLDCSELRVTGDVHFGKDITMHGAVQIANHTDRPVVIPDGASISGEYLLQ